MTLASPVFHDHHNPHFRSPFACGVVLNLLQLKWDLVFRKRPRGVEFQSVWIHRNLADPDAHFRHFMFGVVQTAR